MLFSVIVPVFNVEKYIDTCLESLVNQTFKDFEIILVDDGSTDSSGVKCDYYAQKYEFITVIHKRNEGLLLTRRRGLSIAKGEYIVHCDSDDYLELTALEKIKKAIELQCPDMIIYGYDVVDLNNNVLNRYSSLCNNYENISKAEVIDIVARFKNYNSMWTKATRRNCVDIGSDYESYKSIKMGEDLLQIIPLIHKSKTFIYIAEPLYHYRYNPSGISKKVHFSYLKNCMIVFTKLYLLLKKEKASRDTLACFFDRYVNEVFKYLLQFSKIGISPEKFIKYYNRIWNNWLFKQAIKDYNSLCLRNKLMIKIIKPRNYIFVKIISKSVISGKLV